MNAHVALAQAREVCPTTTRRRLGEGALMVDVREHAEVARLAFDVPAIVHLPLSAFEQRFAELPRNRELLLVCESGPRSLKATYFLMYQGYTQVANMAGGIVKWMAKGFPVVGQRADAGACTTGACSPGRVPDDSGSCCAPASSAPAHITKAEAGPARACCGGADAVPLAPPATASATASTNSVRCCG